MSDLLGQALLLQARQPRRESTSSRLAQQMLASMNAPPNRGGALDVLNRASAGIFGTLMAQRAEAEERLRDKQGLGAIFDYQRQQQEEADRLFPMPGAAPAAPMAPPQGAPGMGTMTPAAPAAVQPVQGEPGTVAGSGVRYASVPGRDPVGSQFGQPENRGPTIPNPDFNPRLPEGANNQRMVPNPWHELRGQLPPPTGVINPNIGAAPAAQPPAQQSPAQQPQQRDPFANVSEEDLLRGLQSQNPIVRQRAQAIMTMRQASRRELGPTVELGEGPHGPAGIYERLPNGTLRQVGPRAEPAETWDAPRPETVNGRTVMAQYSNRGNRREVPNAGPAPRTESQPQNVRLLESLMAPDADPSSPQYAAAYWSLTQPQPRSMTDVNGNQVTVMLPPELPPGVRPPTFGQQPPAAAPTQAAPALVAGPRAAGSMQEAPLLDAGAPLLGQLPAQPAGAAPPAMPAPQAQPQRTPNVQGLPPGATVLGGGARFPTAVQTAEDADITALSTAGTINTQLQDFRGRIQRGELPLSPITNLAAQARNAMGVDTEASRNFASFRATLERLRNDSLRLNSGVQTEGDAQRAWNELVTNINSPTLVSQRLREIEDLNNRAIELRRVQIQQRRQNFGLPPLDVQQFLAPPPQQPGSGAGWSIRPVQ